MIYSLDLLRKQYQEGNKYKFLFFWGHKPASNGSVDKSCLSQWWMQDFTVDGIRYSCAEQYMMAKKASLFGDESMLKQIMNSNVPKDMKSFGRAVQNFDNAIWNKNCYEIVKTANKAKFSQNSDLLDFLLSTDGFILVEASPRDRIWGIGMGKDNPNANDPMKWRGKNLLGFALTEVREELFYV